MEKKNSRRWPTIVALFVLVAAATYVMIQNPDHQARYDAQSEAEAAYAEVEEVTDSVAAEPVAAAAESAAPSSSQPRQILDEGIPSE